MVGVAEFLLAFVDLLKAELRAGRAELFRFLGAVVLLILGAWLLIGALGLMLAALFIGLSGVMHTAWAALITAGATLFLSGMVFLAAQSRAKS